jgi:5'-3' exoribonuclease 1
MFCLVDNLYLDMNGIIHNCSLPNDTDAHFRLSEDKIFLAIFNYIDHLFLKIKPQKVFFMAIDGKTAGEGTSLRLCE